MKLNKISLIEPPHPEIVLGIGEMNNILGGDTCLTYTMEIGSNGKTCTSVSCGNLLRGDKNSCGGSSDPSHMLCSLYTVTCELYEDKSSCLSYKVHPPCLTYVP